jgi:hypothetical protein
MFRMWVYFAVAAAIAGAAFLIGRIVPGLGMAFAGATTLWTVYAVHRRRRRPRRSSSGVGGQVHFVVTGRR